MKFNASKFRIKSNSRAAANSTSVLARYVETCIKIIQGIQEKKVDPTYNPFLDVDDLLACLLEHMRLLQEDYSALVVEGSFRSKTQQIFRSLQKSTSSFTPSIIDTLKSAITLAGAQESQNQ